MAERITRQHRGTFLEQLAQGFSVTRAATESGVNVRRWYELRDSDEAFREEWADAYASGTDFLRDELRRRAVEGADDFRLDRDGKEHRLKVYSDRLLELELRRRDESYRERQQVELNARVRGELDVGVRIEPDYDEVFKVLVEAGVISQWLEAHPDVKLPELESGDGGDGSTPSGGSVT